MAETIEAPAFAAPMPAMLSEPVAEAIEAVAPPAASVFVATPPAPAPMAAPIAAVPVAATAPAFELPLDSLQAVAEAAGLQWVNSDSSKIRSVQTAMAAEPKPVHAPRERQAAVQANEGPLVLVETRKDLNQIKLPFETASDSHPPA